MHNVRTNSVHGLKALFLFAFLPLVLPSFHTAKSQSTGATVIITDTIVDSCMSASDCSAAQEGGEEIEAVRMQLETVGPDELVTESNFKSHTFNVEIGNPKKRYSFELTRDEEQNEKNIKRIMNTIRAFNPNVSDQDIKKSVISEVDGYLGNVFGNDDAADLAEGIGKIVEAHTPDANGEIYARSPGGRILVTTRENYDDDAKRADDLSRRPPDRRRIKETEAQEKAKGSGLSDISGGDGPIVSDIGANPSS